MNDSWVKLYHATLDSAVMQDDWHFRLFMWCLLKANYRAAGFRGVTVDPGQFVTGRNTGADALNVSPSKFYRGLLTLQDKYNCITVEANSNWTTITICNWKTYQSDGEKSEQQVNSERTASEQQVNSGRTTDEHNLRKKERKNGRREENTRARRAAFDAKLFPIPDELNTPEFLDAWNSWIQHRIEMKKPFTETATKKQFDEFLEWGVPRSVAAMNLSIRSNWQGIFEGKDKPSFAGASSGPHLFDTLKQFVESDNDKN